MDTSGGRKKVGELGLVPFRLYNFVQIPTPISGSLDLPDNNRDLAKKHAQIRPTPDWARRSRMTYDGSVILGVHGHMQ